jgi:hypothetical protein
VRHRREACVPSAQTPPRLRPGRRNSLVIRRFRIKIEATPELGFTAGIIRCAPGRELAWRGGAPLLPSVAWGEHYFRFAPVGEGTELTHGEDFGGLLGLAVRGPVHRQITRTYDAFNRALKTRAETSATST